MPYRSFTYRSVRERLGIDFQQTSGQFATLSQLRPSEWLTQTLTRTRPLVTGRISDKGRAELLTAPVLVEVREQLDRRVALFSGIKFDVDRQAGLCGACDFLLSRDPLLLDVGHPAVVVTGAVREDLNGSTPPCIAVMRAAQRFNTSRDGNTSIYGAVTSGSWWRFLQLDGDTVTIDLREYPITELPLILGILVHMAS